MKKDMHVHSRYSSDCTTAVEDLLEAARRRGLDGIAVTDHNTIQGGVEAAKKAADLEVVVGAEVLTDCGEVVGYGLNEEIRSRSFFDVVDEMKAQGALVSVPHPFDRVRSGSFRSPELILETKNRIDFLEINGRTLPFFNERARGFAADHGFPLLGGSDAHTPMEVGCVYTVYEGEETRVEGASTYLSVPYKVARTKLYKIFGV